MRPRPIEVLRALPTADWWDRTVFAGCVLFAIGLLVLAAMTAAGGVDAARAVTTGPHGTMTVSRCVKDYAHQDPEIWPGGWDCAGPFRSDDGRVTVATVKLLRYADHEPGPRVPGRVSGPSAGWMTADGDYSWLLTLPLTLALIGAAGWSLHFGAEMVEPLMGWPKRPKPPRTTPPQMGNRALRRRRKRRRRAGQGERPKVIR